MLMQIFIVLFTAWVVLLLRRIYDVHNLSALALKSLKSQILIE